MCSFIYRPRDSPLHCMPRRPLIQNTAALVEGVAALDQSLKAVNARLRQMRKTAWTRKNKSIQPDDASCSKQWPFSCCMTRIAVGYLLS